MQTALAVRDTVLTISDVMTYVIVYFITSGAVLIALDGWFVLPFYYLVSTVIIILKILSQNWHTQPNVKPMPVYLMTGRIC